MLEKVPLLEKHIDDYADIVGTDVCERVWALAAPLQGARVLHLNATAYGGGVAELLATHVPLLRSVGVDAEWHVLRGSDEFFGVTKEVHNGLQGAPIEMTPQMRRIYLERVLDNALELENGWDFVVVHDPQPAAILHYLADRTDAFANTKWVWRCHIDLTDAQPDMWEFFRPFVQEYDASVWTMPEFVPGTLDMERIVHAPPCIDPLSVKNLGLAMPFCTEITRQYGIDPKRPIVCQVSRFDPWKDPTGVIEAYRLVREHVTDAQLLLAGSMATDDPEGFRVWEATEEARAGDRDIHLLSNLHQVGAVQINAFQRIASVVVQKSLREGFGLTVSEALWKGRPVVGGRAGGIKLQIREGFDGFLVDDVESCARRIIDLLADPVGADAMGSQGREHVRQNFLSTRELEDWLRLMGDLRETDLVLVVSNRGPFRFSAEADGSFAAHPGGGGLSSALRPLLTDPAVDACWIAAAMGDGDRAAVRAGAADVPDLDLVLLDLDPALARMHYDVVSNQVLWFLHHGMFDLVHRPRFDHHFREAWDAYVAVNRAFADAVAQRASLGDVVLVQDYQLTLVPGLVADARPDLRVGFFTHTPFCGPNSIRVLPTDTAEALLRSMVRAPCGFHTERWARAYMASAREVLGPGVQPHAYAASLGPDPTELAEIASSPAARAALAELDELVHDRRMILRIDRVEPSKNIVRGFVAYDRLLERRPEWRHNVTFVALLNPSRESLPEYLAYRDEVEQVAHTVNERWGTTDWQPIVLDTRDDFAGSIAALERYDVLLVNPIKDGLNLVAKEGPLCNTRDGVVCLSPEAGAYDELDDAVVPVHPYDIEQNADALHRALTMAPDERSVHADRLRRLAATRTPRAWLDDQLAAVG